jgi:hypothetical protein
MQHHCYTKKWNRNISANQSLAPGAELEGSLVITSLGSSVWNVKKYSPQIETAWLNL